MFGKEGPFGRMVDLGEQSFEMLGRVSIPEPENTGAAPMLDRAMDRSAQPHHADALLNFKYCLRHEMQRGNISAEDAFDAMDDFIEYEFGDRGGQES